MLYGIANNTRGKIAEKIVKKIMEARGYSCEKDKSDLLCKKRNQEIYVEVKSKLDTTKPKFRRFNQLTSKKQETFLKKVFKSDIKFKLFVVWFPSLDIKEYDKKDLDLRTYDTRLGYLIVKGERLRK